ncbi:pyrophosphatase [Pararhizobium polonicum]|uniref:Pyrophosphatase n=1 Tax=Pararhizobium polonicum TaxID=1612624 RepID=A0A1C7NYX1_9HYPH|nr:pyrophosphatase [Pararhizobium polonicum]OBZ94169.1 pyrophosphatase [Pararhizobium polonicum]
MLKQLGEAFSRASTAYAETHRIERDRDWFVLKMHEELGELTQIWNKLTGRGRLKGQSQADLHHLLSDETADLLGHVLLFAEQNDIDLAAAIERKWKFRPSIGTPL